MLLSSVLSVALAARFVNAAPAPAPELDARQIDFGDLGGYVSSVINSALGQGFGQFATTATTSSTNTQPTDTGFPLPTISDPVPTTISPISPITPTGITSDPLTFITPTPTLITLTLPTTGTTSGVVATTTAIIDPNDLYGSIYDLVLSYLNGII